MPGPEFVDEATGTRYLGGPTAKELLGWTRGRLRARIGEVPTAKLKLATPRRRGQLPEWAVPLRGIYLVLGQRGTATGHQDAEEAQVQPLKHHPSSLRALNAPEEQDVSADQLREEILHLRARMQSLEEALAKQMEVTRLLLES